MSAGFRHEATKFVKGTAVALSLCLGLTGAIGLRGLALGDLQLCYGDIVRICRPAELPALALFVFLAVTMVAFLAFAKVSNYHGRGNDFHEGSNEHSS